MYVLWVVRASVLLVAVGQDCPHVPFDKLKSQAAQGRLALCRPISGLQESAIVDGVERYAHSSGDIFFCRRAAWQVASTMGFVLNKNTGSFMGLTQEEESALHEAACLGSDKPSAPSRSVVVII